MNSHGTAWLDQDGLQVYQRLLEPKGGEEAVSRSTELILTVKEDANSRVLVVPGLEFYWMHYGRP